MKQRYHWTPTPAQTEWILENYLKSSWFKSGSQVICNPPPENSDHDYFVKRLYGAGFPNVILRLLGFTHDLERSDGSHYAYDEKKFSSWRNGNINIIVADPDTFISTWRATQLAKERNLLDKKERIALFERVREVDGFIRDEEWRKTTLSAYLELARRTSQNAYKDYSAYLKWFAQGEK